MEEAVQPLPLLAAVEEFDSLQTVNVSAESVVLSLDKLYQACDDGTLLLVQLSHLCFDAFDAFHFAGFMRRRRTLWRIS